MKPIVWDLNGINEKVFFLACTSAEIEKNTKSCICLQMPVSIATEIPEWNITWPAVGKQQPDQGFYIALSTY